MDKFESVFDNQTEDDEKFDTMFGSQEDGDLIDAVVGFGESGECETDFDELHQTDDDADPDDFEAELGEDHDTDNAPIGAEGSDVDPAINLAMGEQADDEFSANGVGCGNSDADNFYSDGDEPESAQTGEGPDVDPNEMDTDGEFDSVIGATLGEGYEDHGLTNGTDDDNVKDLEGENNPLDEDSEDMDSMMDNLDADDAEGECSVKESDEYEEGDSDLVDLVSGE